MHNGRHAPLSKIPAELLRRLSPKRRDLVRPTFDRPRDYVLLSIRKLAAVLDADAMAILRAIRGMGFEGYGEFRQYLHELALVQATQLDSMQPPVVGRRQLEAQLRECLSRDTSHLAALRDGVNVGRLEQVARRLHGARRIVLLGGDLASVLVNFLQYNLAVLDLPAIACTRAGEVVHAVRGVRKSDAVIGITFRRGLRQTVEGLRQAHANAAFCVAITDTHLSPLARFSQECFVTPVESAVYGVSYVAPMALLNMLLVACAGTRKARTKQLLKAADAEQRSGFRWYEQELPGPGTSN